MGPEKGLAGEKKKLMVEKLVTLYSTGYGHIHVCVYLKHTVNNK